MVSDGVLDQFGIVPGAKYVHDLVFVIRNRPSCHPQDAADRDAHAGNESLGETDLILHFMSEAALFRRKRRIVGEHSGIAKDSGEGIVDFVGGLALALH